LIAIRIKKPDLVLSQAEQTQKYFVIFGGLAVMITLLVTVDPWLCVAGFRRVCLYRMLLCVINISRSFEKYIAAT